MSSKTNNTTQAIIDIVNSYGGFAKRINTSGIPIIKGNKIIGWRKSKSKGHPDIDGCYKGYSFKVEVKTGKDELRKEQILFINDYERAGGKCFVVKDSVEFEIEFKKWSKIK